MSKISAKRTKAAKIVRKGSKKFKRKLKKTRNKMVRGFVCSALLFGAGTCVGMYHEEIMLWIRKMELKKKLADLREEIIRRR